jgi:DNA-binding protein WhiA
MSFSHDVKRELAANPPQKRRLAEARANGFFLFLRILSADEISFHTESLEAAGSFDASARTLLGARTRTNITEALHVGKPIYTCRLPALTDRQRLLETLGTHAIERLKNSEEAGAFLAGAFLAVGSLSDPEKRCHLEFSARRESLARALYALLETAIPGAKLTARRGACIIYYKDRSQIGDLLTLMGASKASLALIEVELIKGVRNRANRVTNCETANIDKTVSAAAAQIADITQIDSRGGFSSLPLDLQETAALRLAHPELSLRELSALHTIPPTRSMLHRRFEKLAKIASKSN